MASFCLNDYGCIAFDMDHTLLRYNLPQLSAMIYHCITEYLRQHKNYDPAVLDQGVYEKHQDLCMRGLVFDYRKGNFLKLGSNGLILSCLHGFDELNKEEVSLQYGLERKWPSFEQLEQTLAAGPGFGVFESFYTTPIIPLICAIVDHFDKKNGLNLSDYEFLWKDICEAFEGNFNYKSFKEERNIFMPSLKAQPWKYVYKIPESTINWLKKLRETKVVILITYTFANLAEHLMTYAVDADWKELFDFVIGYARKPAFFQESSKDTPFYTMTTDEDLSLEEVSAVQTNKIYLRGSSRQLEKEIMRHLQIDRIPRFVYFGDSIRGDVFGPSHHTDNWDGVAIVEEMQWEETLYPSINSSGGTQSMPQPPSTKRTESDELFICSKHWGSFFFDNKIMLDEQQSDESYPSTFWMDVLGKYSKLAVPLLDYIVDLPIDGSFSSLKNC